MEVLTDQLHKPADSYLKEERVLYGNDDGKQACISAKAGPGDALREQARKLRAATSKWYRQAKLEYHENLQEADRKVWPDENRKDIPAAGTRSYGSWNMTTPPQSCLQHGRAGTAFTADTENVSREPSAPSSSPARSGSRYCQPVPDPAHGPGGLSPPGQILLQFLHTRFHIPVTQPVKVTQLFHIPFKPGNVHRL